MQILAAFFAVLATIPAHAQTPDLFGFSSNQTAGELANAYVIRNTAGKVAVKLGQNEVSRVLLTGETGAVRDLFGQVTWFDRDANVLVQGALGLEFKLSDQYLAVYTPKGPAKVYGRDGSEVFSTTRPVRGMSVTSRRIGWIDDYRDALEVRDRRAEKPRTFAFVRNAWMSDTFVYTRSVDGNRDQLYIGADFGLQPPTRKSRSVQLSDDLAVLTAEGGKVRVYGPRGWIRDVPNVLEVHLTSNYLALTMAAAIGSPQPAGIDLYRTDGTFVTRYLPGVQASYNNDVIQIRLSTGATRLVRPTASGRPLEAVIPRSDLVVASAGLAVALNAQSFEAYDLSPDAFGNRIYGGPRTIDAKAVPVVGLRSFGFVYPQARSAQFFIPANSGGFEGGEAAPVPVLDERFVSRLDASMNAPSLNWTMF